MSPAAASLPRADAAPDLAPAGVPTTAPPRPLALHIDRLVLDEAALGGLRLDAPGQSALQASLQTELTRLLASDGAADRLAATGALARVNAGDLPVTAGQTPAQLGRALARQLARALQQERQP